MDGSGSMNMTNWSIFEPASALKDHLGLQLMSTKAAEKPLFGGGGREQHPRAHNPLRNHQQTEQYQAHHHVHPPVVAVAAASINCGFFQHHRMGGFTEPSLAAAEYMRDSLMNHDRERYLNMLSHNNNPHHHHGCNYGGVLPESSSGAHSMQVLKGNSLGKNDENVGCGHLQLQESCEEERDVVDVGVVKKRGGVKHQGDNKLPKAKKAKKVPKDVKDDECNGGGVGRGRGRKKSAEVVINGMSMDICGIPIPVCTCTGSPQQCYRWGSGGWQSACCTTGLSMYPLPMSTKRRGARIAGRKMSMGAFKKVLEKLALEAYNFSNPIDLRTYWAKHGTNKFVTIR